MTRRGCAPLRRAGMSAAALALVACAPSGHYMGISLAPGAAEAPLQQLATRAQAGDKQAQLELGMRYEEGRGVPRDRSKAMSLYGRAARDDGGRLWVYSPGVGQAKGQVIPIDTGMRREGLPEARARLRHLRSPAAAAPPLQDRGTRAPDEPVVESSQDVPVLRPPEGESLLRGCRTRPGLSSWQFAAAERYAYGYCQGYITSKISRLPAEKLREIEARRERLRAQAQLPSGSWIVLDVLDILRSPAFDDGHLAELRRRYGERLSAEMVLDHAVDLLYAAAG